MKQIQLILDAGWSDFWLAGCFLALLAAYFWRSARYPRRILLLRSLAVAAILFFLLKPSLLMLEGSVSKPRLAVLVDVSSNMGTVDALAGKTRLAQARRWLEEHRGELEEKLDVTWFAVSEQALKTTWERLKIQEAQKSRLNLAKSLDDVYREGGGQWSAVWVFTDGAGDASADLSHALSQVEAPVQVFGVSAEERSKGFSVKEWKGPDLAFLHMPVTLTAAWEANGVKSQRVKAAVFHGDQIVAQKEIAVDADFAVGLTTFAFIPSSLGKQSYRLEMGSQRRTATVDVVRDKLRILYLCGRVNAEYSYLRHFIKSHPSFELVSFVILRDPEDSVSVSDRELALIPFPAQEIFVNDLFQFDVFILQNFSYSRFGLPKAYLGNVERFIRKGGGLLVIGGEDIFSDGAYLHTAFEDILPVKLPEGSDLYRPGSFALKPRALQHPMLQWGGERSVLEGLWAGLPPLYGSNRFGAPRPDGVVLAVRDAGGEAEPVVVAREIEKGRVLVAGTQSTWRWKLGEGSVIGAGSFYNQFWDRAVEYLSGSLDLEKVNLQPDLSVQVLDETFNPLDDPSARVEIRLSGAQGYSRTFAPRQVQPGKYRIEPHPDLPPGGYKAQADVYHRGKLWGRSSREIRLGQEFTTGKPLQRALLKEIAERTGGAYRDLSEASYADLAKQFPKPKLAKEITVQKAVWGSSYVLWAALACLLLEWFWRIRMGL
ncbi:MAG: hypothetical protein HY611_08095 [Elusimicrobia bacterium]|nr:hypothetical protein [Elusimicrobiota bacterium]